MPSTKTDPGRLSARIRIRGPRLSVERRISAPPEAVWDLVTDTVKWPRWGPSVSRATCSDRHIRKGSRGTVRLSVGLTVPFVVTEFKPGRYWGWKVAGIPATGHRLDPLCAGACRLSFEMPLYWLPYTVVCEKALQRIAQILEKGTRGRGCRPIGT